MAEMTYLTTQGTIGCNGNFEDSAPSNQNDEDDYVDEMETVTDSE